MQTIKNKIQDTMDSECCKCGKKKWWSPICESKKLYHCEIISEKKVDTFDERDNEESQDDITTPSHCYNWKLLIISLQDHKWNSIEFLRKRHLRNWIWQNQAISSL